MEQRLFLLQRLSAMVLAPLVLVHLVVILYAVRSGLTAAAVLGRTQGNWVWIGIYTLFVVAVAVHVPIGMRNVLVEWLGLTRLAAGLVAAFLGIVLLVMGLRAVAAIGGLL